MTFEPTKCVKFFDAATGREMMLNEDEGGWKGWLFFKHPDGQWVSQRKATDEDILRLIERGVITREPDSDTESTGEAECELDEYGFCKTHPICEAMRQAWDAAQQKLDATVCSHQDEEAAHQETIRMRKLCIAQRDALQAEADLLDRVCCRCGYRMANVQWRTTNFATCPRCPAALSDFRLTHAVVITPTPTVDRETLGRVVREAWVKRDTAVVAIQLPDAELREYDAETDRCIADAVIAALTPPAAPQKETTNDSSGNRFS